MVVYLEGYPGHVLCQVGILVTSLETVCLQWLQALLPDDLLSHHVSRS